MKRINGNLLRQCQRINQIANPGLVYFVTLNDGDSDPEPFAQGIRFVFDFRDKEYNNEDNSTDEILAPCNKWFRGRM